MHLVQLLLPLYGRDGKKIPAAVFMNVRTELTKRFGGVTAYSHSPATGLWKKQAAQIERDLIILMEVVVKPFNRLWWTRYRRVLEKRFHQDRLLARALKIELF